MDGFLFRPEFHKYYSWYSTAAPLLLLVFPVPVYQESIHVLATPQWPLIPSEWPVIIGILRPVDHIRNEPVIVLSHTNLYHIISFELSAAEY